MGITIGKIVFARLRFLRILLEDSFPGKEIVVCDCFKALDKNHNYVTCNV